MLFNSFEFLFFLPLVFAAYWLLVRCLRAQNLLVVVASYGVLRLVGCAIPWVDRLHERLELSRGAHRVEAVGGETVEDFTDDEPRGQSRYSRVFQVL